jgi:hypothetical protein
MDKICAGFSGIMLVTPLQSGGWRYDIVDDLNIYWTIYSTGHLLGQSTHQSAVAFHTKLA